MAAFTWEDCIEAASLEGMENRVFVLPENELGQLFYCIKDMGVNLQAVSLRNGEVICCQKKDVVGLLKPELLPDSEKLQLSQIRPVGAAELPEQGVEYFGYSFLPDGKYAAGVWLRGPEEVWSYARMQKDYQYRVLICDRDDFAVLEFVKGMLVFPDQQDLQKFLQKSEGGIQMG